MRRFDWRLTAILGSAVRACPVPWNNFEGQEYLELRGHVVKVGGNYWVSKWSLKRLAAFEEAFTGSVGLWPYGATARPKLIRYGAVGLPIHLTDTDDRVTGTCPAWYP